ncbi:MAG: type II secretion system protein [Cyanobacteriota bacterium]|nr:type II secretion system protein [Cyanobacteriota bacterium]
MFPLPPSPSRYRGRRLPAFTAIEMLVGATVSVILVGSLGALALISELRMGREAEVNQSLRDTWGRTMAFIANEAQQSYWIRTNLTPLPDITSGYPCTGNPPDNLLVLDGPPNPTNPTAPTWRVVYGVRENKTTEKDWRGFNRLVRCGPPFELISRDKTTGDALPAALRAAALAGNLSYTEASTETVIADQLAESKEIPCPTPPKEGTSLPGNCYQPFQARVFDYVAGRDRDAQLSLFLSRRTGSLYPPASFPAFHTQIRASRNPGFDVNGNSSCNTVLDSSGSGNQVPSNTSACETNLPDHSSGRKIVLKEFNLPNVAGTYTINGCGVDCDGPEKTDINEVIFLKGNYDAFTTKQFSSSDSTRACSRKSCYLSNGIQNVQIYDGNLLVFYDRILRL